MTTNLRSLAYEAVVKDLACRPEYIAEFCKVMVLAQRRPKFGAYDDSITLITPETEYTFAGNTDPSRTGWNPGVGKLYAQLTPGVWPVRTGEHRGRPGNFRQMTSKEAAMLQLHRFFSDGRAQGKYTVKRVAKDLSGKTESGYFAINGHSGAQKSTSSWGCWTVPPDDWDRFQSTVYFELGKHNQLWPAGWFPLVLVDA